MADLQTDRRAFLAAAPALAVITAGPAAKLPVTNSRAAWDAAMQAHIDAKAAYVHFDRTVHEPLFRRQQAFYESHKVYSTDPGWVEKRDALIAQYGSGHLIPKHIDDELDRLALAEDDAELALMQMPAPDLRALNWKLDRVFDLDADGMQPWTLKYVGQTMADYRRLLGGA